MVVAVICDKSIIFCLILKQRIHTLYFKIHFNAIGKPVDHVGNSYRLLAFLWVHGSAYSCKQVGVIRCNGLLRSQMQRANKGFSQFRKEMQRSS